MSLNYTGVELKTAHSLDSWNGGVMVMASGSVQLKDYNNRKNFVQTFFLAPQEKGFFVLNDFFHFIDDEPAPQHSAVLLAQSTLTNMQPVAIPTYLAEMQSQTRQYVAHADVKENGSAEDLHFSEQKLPHVSEPKSKVEDKPPEYLNDSTQNSASATLQPTSPSVVEPKKLTYASILRIAKEQPVVAHPTHPMHQNTQTGPERHHPPPSMTPQQSSTPTEDKTEVLPVVENQGDVKSIYVRNLPSDVSVHAIEEQFKSFGTLKPDGVVIRSREDVDVCYAFVEFEDIEGVQNAIKASTIEIGGRQVHIEERRAKNSFTSRGGSMLYSSYTLQNGKMEMRRQGKLPNGWTKGKNRNSIWARWQ
uniref:G3BP-like protein n=2 Tax=Kalanchoe fedtschenkoi TaxID=63787 RepID=A0A7N0ZY75_KALFE